MPLAFLKKNCLDDILNVRLQTLGVVEHHLKIDMFGVVYDWKMYDVGGSRGQVSCPLDIPSFCWSLVLNETLFLAAARMDTLL